MENAYCIEAAEIVEKNENNKWKVWRTVAKKENKEKENKNPEHKKEIKMFPIFNIPKIKQKIKISEPKLRNNYETAGFDDLDDTHCLEIAEQAEKNGGGGPPMGAVLIPNFNASTEYSQEGDPPIGKERGTPGVGTGPTPPPQGQLFPPKFQHLRRNNKSRFNQT